VVSLTAVRYRASISRPFVLEGGSAETDLKDGALEVVPGLTGFPLGEAKREVQLRHVGLDPASRPG
jgi:hypothetical protein